MGIYIYIVINRVSPYSNTYIYIYSNKYGFPNIVA